MYYKIQYDPVLHLTRVARIIFSGFTSVARVTDIRVHIADADTASTDGTLIIKLPKSFLGHDVASDSLLATGLLAHELSHWLQPIQDLNDLVKKHRVRKWFVNICMDVHGEVLISNILSMYSMPLKHVRKIIDEEIGFIYRERLNTLLNNPPQQPDQRKDYMAQLAYVYALIGRSVTPKRAFVRVPIAQETKTVLSKEEIYELAEMLKYVEYISLTKNKELPKYILRAAQQYRWLFEDENIQQQQQRQETQLVETDEQQSFGNKATEANDVRGNDNNDDDGKKESHENGKCNNDDQDEVSKDDFAEENPLGDSIETIMGYLNSGEQIRIMYEQVQRFSNIEGQTSCNVSVLQHPIKREYIDPEAVRLSRRIAPRFMSRSNIEIMAPGRLKRREIMRSEVPFQMNLPGKHDYAPHVIICLDVSGSMRGGYPSKISVAQRIAQAVTLAMEDSGGTVIGCAFASDAVYENKSANMFFYNDIMYSLGRSTGNGTTFLFLPQIWYQYPGYQYLVITDGHGTPPSHIPQEHKKNTTCILIPPETNTRKVESWSRRQIVLYDINRLGSVLAMLVPRKRVG